MFTLKNFGDVWISKNVPIDLASALSAYESASAKTPDAFTTYSEFEAALSGKKSAKQALDDAVARGNQMLRQFERTVSR